MVNARKVGILAYYFKHKLTIHFVCRTYQEGFLARRRLVFTHSQRYFQCLQTHTCEGLSVSFRSESLHARFGDSLYHSLQVFPPMFNQIQQREADSQFEFEEQIREYLRRTLRYESATRNPFKGVLCQAGYGVHKTYHFWRLPFRPTGSALGSLYSGFLNSFFVEPIISGRISVLDSKEWISFLDLGRLGGYF
jgi:hypothetical protein